MADKTIISRNENSFDGIQENRVLEDSGTEENLGWSHEDSAALLKPRSEISNSFSIDIESSPNERKVDLSTNFGCSSLCSFLRLLFFIISVTCLGFFEGFLCYLILLPQGDFRVDSASASIFNVSSSLSTANWNISFCHTNSDAVKISYPTVKVFIFYNDMFLSGTTLQPFHQLPNSTMFFDVSFPPLPADIDGWISDSIMRKRRSGKSVYIDLEILGTSIYEYGDILEYPKGFRYSCYHVELEFEPTDKAEIMKRQPILCDSARLH